MLSEIKATVTSTFDNLQQRAINEYNAMVATEETRQQRLQQCNACKHLIKITGNCDVCGCFVSLKTRLKESSCPIGKW